MPWNGSFQFRKVPLPKPVLGISYILRPLLSARLYYQERVHQTFILPDSGADFSFLPIEVAQDLGIDPTAIPGEAYPLGGVTGAGIGRFVNIDVEISSHGIPHRFTLPFMVLQPGQGSESGGRQVLIGRYPFFYMFDVSFRMGFTDDPELGKWTLHEVVKHRPAKRFGKSAPIPTVRR